MTVSQPKWQLIKKITIDMCLQNNGIVTISRIKKKFEELYPTIESSDVGDDIRMMTVNSQSRLSHLRIFGKPSPGKQIRNPNLKGSDKEYSRIADPKNEKDVLFDLKDIGVEGYEIYEPSKHGTVEIVLDSDNVNHFKIQKNLN